MLYQLPLAPRYAQLGDEALKEGIREFKRRLGKRLVILGHHYQQDDVIEFSDFTGDSLKLSMLAAEQKEADTIVFCGVHFMAESADILAGDHQTVVLPDLSAGCSMADMAHIDQVEECWPLLTDWAGCPITPITYVNSSAAVKSFVGRHDGACCTSSNARMVMEWALHGATPPTGGQRNGGAADLHHPSCVNVTAKADEHDAGPLPGAAGNTSSSPSHARTSQVHAMQASQSERPHDARKAGIDMPTAPRSAALAAPPLGQPGHKVMFLPDQHLGRNTAHALGWPLESMVVYDPKRPEGGLTRQQVRDARVILWKGHCSVHQLFNTQQVAAIRSRPEPYQVLVHPECSWEVCQQADLVGSTEYIIKTVRDAAAGSYWAVGTEVHLVQRLAKQFPDRHIRSLANIQCLCTTMYRIDLKHLYWTLEHLAEGKPVNVIEVDAETKRWSKFALDRMLALRPSQPVSAK